MKTIIKKTVAWQLFFYNSLLIFENVKIILLFIFILQPMGGGNNVF